MLKNREFKRMMIAAACLTVAASVCAFILSGWIACIITFLLGAAFMAMYYFFTGKRYADIAELDSYLVKVLAGAEVPDITDQQEGELSILRNNIYKVTTTLYYQKELLAGDKKALSDAIADISHQLKTPLTSMMVMNDLLGSEDDPEKRAEFLKTQSGQLDRMNWLVQTLLKLSKIDAGTIVMKPEEVLAKPLISEIIKPFEVQMDIKNIECGISTGDFVIKCDRNWTVEAVQNIVKNCIEHMEEGGRLDITCEETNLFTQIVIKDTGCGIAEEDIPHIFERFYKGKNAGKDSVGIGLALAKTIMEGQHGDILVSSKEGEGTEFRVRFYKTIV
ncbi:MAG: HAMP domain-containing histidine kinase [Lachnospiraceae bacterium]|nr:HAMP domain-containing histidine kinase [Lachnospiraceae bacterium]